MLEDIGSAVIVRAAGELDRLTALLLREAVEDACRTAKPVIIDLQDIHYFDLGGVRALEWSRSRAAQDGCDLLIVSPPGTVSARVLALMDVAGSLEIFASRGDAVARLAHASTK